MNILLTINNAFYRQAIVLLQSIIDNNNAAIHVYIVHSGLQENEIQAIQNYCSRNNIILSMILQNDALFDGLRMSGPFPHEVYYRILAHEYLPKTEDRVLYLDTDIICNGSIEELYQMDFESNYLIACAQEDAYWQDPNYIQKHWDNVTAARGKYFNNGVLLMNCRRFRDDNITIDTYLEGVKSMIPNYVFDQGLFNYLFARETKLIPEKDYNYRYGKVFLQSPDKSDVTPNLQAKIIHFAGEISPYKAWDLLLDDEEIKKYCINQIKYDKAPNFIVNKAINDLSKIWWLYAQRTFLYEELLHEMNVKKEWFKRGISGYLKRLVVAVAAEQGE